MCHALAMHLTLLFTYTEQFNSLPHDKFGDRPKLKAFAGDKLNVTVKLKFVLARAENIVGKRENAGYTEVVQYPVFNHLLPMAQGLSTLELIQ